MTTEAEVFRFVPTAYVRVSKETQARATEEADAYKFMRLGNGHYACAHEKQAYVIIEKDGKIGCSCHAMIFNCTGNEVCKHIAAFQALKNPPAAKPTSIIVLDLLAAGWRKNEHGNLYPPDAEQKDAEAAEREKEIDSAMDASWNKDHPEATSDEEGNDNEGSDPTPAEPPKRPPVPAPGLGEKVYSRSCPHCDERIEGVDLDDVKKRHREHIAGCEKNPANKQKSPRLVTQTVPETEIYTYPDGTEFKSMKAMEDYADKREKIAQKQEEETKMAEPETKTYPHPDGTEFPSAEALMDYNKTQKTDKLFTCKICGKKYEKDDDALNCIEKCKAATPTRQAIRRHKPMIKGISPQLQELGRIAVGEKGGRSKSGKTLLPTKLDHFIFTTLDKDDEDRYIRDAGMMEMFGDGCTEIPIRLLYNDIELNFPTFYAKYARSGIKIRGDGENWTVYNADGSREEVFDPNNEKGFLDDKDVKPHGILTVLVEGQNSVGGVFKFRTTSWNSINNILSSLALIKNMCGMLTYIPLKLVLRKKEVTPIGMGHKTWIPVVSVEFRGSIEELQMQAIEVRRLTSGTQREEMRQIEAAVRDHLDEDETIEVQKDVASEFAPGVV